MHDTGSIEIEGGYYYGTTPNSGMLLKYTVDNGQHALMELTARYDGS